MKTVKSLADLRPHLVEEIKAFFVRIQSPARAQVQTASIERSRQIAKADRIRDARVQEAKPSERRVRPALRSAGRLRRDEQRRIGFQGRRACHAENTLAFKFMAGSSSMAPRAIWKGLYLPNAVEPEKSRPGGVLPSHSQSRIYTRRREGGHLRQGVQAPLRWPLHCRHCKGPRLFACVRTASAAQRSSRSISTLNTAIRSARVRPKRYAYRQASITMSFALLHQRSWRLIGVPPTQEGTVTGQHRSASSPSMELSSGRKLPEQTDAAPARLIQEKRNGIPHRSVNCEAVQTITPKTRR